MKEKPSYYAVIPADVRYSEIPPNAKLLYGEITALCNKEGFCWATNKYFATLYGVHEKTVSDWFSILSKAGFIEIQLTKAQKGVEVSRKILLPHRKKTDTPPRKKTEDNNTSINNTSINNTVVLRAKREKREDIDILLKGIEAQVGMIDDPKNKQRFFAKNFLDSKLPEIFLKKHQRKPTTQEAINATIYIFKCAANSSDKYIANNASSMHWVYNNIGRVLRAQNNNRVAIVS